MKATIGCFLCVFLLSKIALSENNSNGFIKNGTKGQQEGAEEFSGLMLEQILDECRRLRKEVTSLRIAQAELERASIKRITDLEHQNLLSRQEFSKLLELVDKRAKYYQNESLEENQISKRLMLNTESGMPLTPQIAFSAILSNYIVNPYQSERIVFDSTVTNSGNGYNKNNGLFVTPVKGVYVFFATVVTLTGKYTESQIVRNGNNIGNIFSAGTTTYGTGSIMTVTNLELGDAVWVRVAGPLHDRGTVDGGFTQFSGFLLFETF
ncbi:complement C1q and tumor necrosis factor-related protein 9-like [Crassostrea virginica]